LAASAGMDVPLTTVHQPSYEMGKAACERLIQRIENKGNNIETKKIVFKTKLVIRKSCGDREERRSQRKERKIRRINNES